MAVRLFVILARESPVGVIFRRGPSKQVQLIKWNTEEDEFYFGQWFKGRIYERRCDLSPSGDKLIYFASAFASFKDFNIWTAISKPPYFTALSLWPKEDTYGGGGLFASETEILLRHKDDEMQLAKEFTLPDFIRVKSIGDDSSFGGDWDVYHMRLIREGWLLKEEHFKTLFIDRTGAWKGNDTVCAYVKTFKIAGGIEFELEMRLRGLEMIKSGSWYFIEYLLRRVRDNVVVSFGNIDWADCVSNGDILFAREGKLFRLSPDLSCEHVFNIENARMLCDFTDFKYKRKASPPEARQW